MRQRAASAGIGIIVFVVLLQFYGSTVFTAACSLLAAGGTYEFCRATKIAPKRPLYRLACCLFAFLSPFLMDMGLVTYLICAAGFCFVLMSLTVLDNAMFRFDRMAVAVFGSVFIPTGFWCLSRLGSPVYLVLTCLAVWGTDAGAYIIGSAAGKRPMCPDLSPHKTWEGFLGGIASGVFAFAVGSLVVACMHQELELVPGYPGLVALACSLSGTVGDLFASGIKRTFRVKDFGRIMPGHGGILDRFDSMLFTAPVALACNWLLPMLVDKATGENWFRMLFR